MRIIDKELRENTWFGALNEHQRLAWLMLILVVADDQGRFEMNVKALRDGFLAGDLISDEEVLNPITAFVLAKKILEYEVDGVRYGQLVNWWRYQNPEMMEKSMLPAPNRWNDRARSSSMGITRSRR